jgi:hypothetical protein
MNEIISAIQENIVTFLILLGLGAPTAYYLWRRWCKEWDNVGGSELGYVDGYYQDGLETKQYGVIDVKDSITYHDLRTIPRNPRTAPDEFEPSGSQWKDPTETFRGNFHKHKINCDSCGAPLENISNKIATCEFCQSQYYLEGYEKIDVSVSASAPAHSINVGNSYWVDGGVSMRDSPASYAVWLN